MKNAQADTTLYYENKWLSLTEQKGKEHLLVKTLKSEALQSNWQQEQSLLEEFDHLSIVRTLAAEENAKVKTYQLPSGRSLYQVIEENRTTFAERLKIAEQLLELVLNFNQRKRFFCDLNWHLFWYDLLEEKLYLLDVLMTIEVSNSASYRTTWQAEAERHCIAPEQTLTHLYAPDIRSNFYSLGVILYALFTGQKPHEGSDRLSVIHKHLSLHPIAPHESKANIGLALSNFILKLLAKNPEERYQSTKGIQWDFQQIQSNPEVAIELGQRDFPSQFHLPESIFFRQKEHHFLKGRALETQKAQKSLVLLEGERGVGMDNILEDLMCDLKVENFYVGKGKYLKASGVPYLGIKEITADLIDQITRQDAFEIAQIRRDLDEKIGNLSGVMIAFQEGFQTLFSTHQAVPELTGTSAALNRFIYAFTEFLSVLEEQGKSVIFCIEDLHLANYVSLRLLEQLLKTSVLSQFMLVASYIEERDAWTSYFADFIETIEKRKSLEYATFKQQIVPFSADSLKQMLLQLKVEPLEELQRILYEKTNGNFDFIKQFFGALVTNNWIEPNFEQQKWEVSIASIQNLHLSSDIDEFLISRIQQLDEQELTLLKMASVIGQKFKLSQLRRIAPFERTTTIQIVDELRAKDFLIPLTYKQAKLYELQFAHNGFLEVLNQLITPEEYEQIKLKLAQDIAEYIEADSDHVRLYELVNHLFAVPAELCQNYTDYLLQTAKKAKKETAYDTAAKCFGKLLEIGLLPNNSNQKQQFEYAYEACNATLLGMDYSKYENLLKTLSDYASDDLQRYQIYILKAKAHMQLEQYQQAIDNMITGLRDMGIRFSEKISKFDQIGIFMQNMWRTRNLNVNTVEQFPFNQDELTNIAQNLILTSSAAVYFLSPPLTSRMTKIGIQSIVNKGLLPSSPGDLVSAGFAVNSFSNLVDKANSLAQSGLKLLESKITDTSSAVVSNFLYAAFIKHTAAPLLDCIELLETYYKKGRESGNIYTAFYCLGMNRWYLFFDGMPLSKLQESLAASHQLAIDANQNTVDSYHKILKSLVVELQREKLAENVLADFELGIHNIDLQKADRTVTGNITLARMIIQVAKGEILEDEVLAKGIQEYLDNSGHGTFNAITIIFYTLLHAFKTTFYDKKFDKKFIKKYFKVLETRTQSAPANHAAKYCLLLALQAKKQNKIEQAHRFFQQAYHAAVEYDNPWNSGLVMEEYAKFLMAQGQLKMGTKIMEEAIIAYQKWGATGIVNRLKTDFPELRVTQQFDAKESNATVEQNEELQKVFHWGKRVLEEENLDLQIQILLEAVEDLISTERSVFVLDFEENLKIYSEKWRGKTTQIIDAVADAEQLPLSLIKVVKRRQEALLLKDVSSDQQFAKDPYIQAKKTKSILCLPFVKNNEVKSLLYLENSLSKGVFSEQKMDLVKVLYKQVSTVLDHAVLTEMLEEKLELRAKQIQLERDKADELLRNILPQKIALELKENGKVKAKKHESVSVLFTDFKDFSKYSNVLTADQIIGGLDECYRAFDEIVARHQLEKIKTIGDSYMCAGGIPESQDKYELKAVKAALEMIDFIDCFNEKQIQKGLPAMSIRAGIHTGPVVAGVVGIKKYAYDIWGSTVNIASRMESHSEAGQLNISGSVYLKIKNHYDCEYRGKIEAKNIGEVDMYFVKQAR
ncbi:MAG: adenylate/guanylate cyclase domain-containing protein [Bacteroidota bacterium]